MKGNVKKILLFSSMLLMVMAGCSGKNGVNGTNGTNGLNGTGIPVLSFVPVNTEAVMLTWTQPYGATSYTVYSSAVSGGSYSAIGTTTTTQYLVNDLTPGTTYYFAVTAVFSSGESLYSNVVSFRAYAVYTYTVGSRPYGIAIDASGNVWVANNNDNTVSEITSTTGTPYTTTIAVGSGPFGIAIDHSGNVWVTNHADGTISEISGGVAHTTTTAFSGPVAIAIDQAGNIWVSDYSNDTLTELDSTGAVQQVFPVCSSPQPVAIDVSGNVWVGSWGGYEISEVTAQFTGYTYTVGGEDSTGLAVDQYGDLWATFDDSGDFYQITSLTTTPTIHTVISRMSNPQGIAIDASGNVWIVDYDNGNVTEFDRFGNQLASYLVGYEPEGIAIDASGNVWVTNTGDGTVTELVGAAQGPQYFPCQYSTAAGNTCPQFQGGGNWGWD